MKRFASFVLIFIFVASLFVATSMTIFAEDTVENIPAPEEQTDLTWNNLSAAIKNIDVTDMNSIKAAYNTLKGVLKSYYHKLVTFIKSNETYSDIATAILGILAFITFPIIIGLIVIAYITIGAMILFAGALTAVVELVLGVVSTLVPI